jgi:hypothetical protein
MTTSEPGAIAPDRYRIERLLGEGSRKRVSLACDEVLGRHVALAVLRTDGLDCDGLARLRDEARSMARHGPRAAPRVALRVTAGAHWRSRRKVTTAGTRSSSPRPASP